MARSFRSRISTEETLMTYLTTFAPFVAPFALLAALPDAAHAETPGRARAEITVGYDRLSSHDDFVDLPDRLAGTRVGGAIGYDVAVSPRVMIGVEADAGWTLDSAKTVPLARDRLTQELKRDLGLSMRVSVAVSPSTTLFAKAGYANSRFTQRYDFAVIGGYETERRHYDRSGVRLGAGIEQALSGAIYAKAEYRWTRYGGDFPYMLDPDRSQILVGVGTHF
jgi:outer membrane immunogenic protein